MASWIKLYIGSPSPTCPAALEAPTAITPEAKLAAGTTCLHRKYGTCKWNLGSSALFRSTTDAAGRFRGHLAPLAEVPPELQPAHEATTRRSAVLACGDLSRPLSAQERESIWQAYDDSTPGGSQFKMRVAALLGPEVQAAVVAVINAMPGG